MVELAVDDPARELSEVLGRLKLEKVAGESVTILYHMERPSDDVLPNDYPVTVESMARFRGLESPVVIIYAPNSIGDVPLFCAYSRATSRCLVIYSAYEVTKRACGAFGNMLLDSEQGAAIREAATAGSTTGIINGLVLSVERVVYRVGRVDWCRDWGAWLIPPEAGTGVTAALWLDHLSLVTDEPIYYWDDRNRGPLLRSKMRLELTDGLDLGPMVLSTCKGCRRVTPHTVLRGAPDVCALCESPDHLPAGEPPEARGLAECDSMLASADQVSGDVKRPQPPTIIALGRWTALDEEHRARLAEAVLSAGGSVGYRAALVLTGIDVVQTEPGKELILDSMAKRYYSWSMWMSARLPLAKWREMVALALSRWKQRGLIESKGKGIFYRL